MKSYEDYPKQFLEIVKLFAKGEVNEYKVDGIPWNIANSYRHSFYRFRKALRREGDSALVQVADAIIIELNPSVARGKEPVDLCFNYIPLGALGDSDPVEAGPQEDILDPDLLNEFLGDE